MGVSRSIFFVAQCRRQDHSARAPSLFCVGCASSPPFSPSSRAWQAAITQPSLIIWQENSSWSSWSHQRPQRPSCRSMRLLSALLRSLLKKSHKHNVELQQQPFPLFLQTPSWTLPQVKFWIALVTLSELLIQQPVISLIAAATSLVKQMVTERLQTTEVSP